jgi:dihydrofolate reductase
VKELALMVAIARNGAIGLKGDLPWSFPEDRAWFEETTRGHVMIMGRRTFEEAGAPFGRTSVVVSKTLRLPEPQPHVFVVQSLDAALERAWSLDPMPFVIGGVGLFTEALPRVTRMYLTGIPLEPEADTFLNLDRTGFELIDVKSFASGLKFETLQRR